MKFINRGYKLCSAQGNNSKPYAGVASLPIGRVSRIVLAFPASMIGESIHLTWRKTISIMDRVRSPITRSLNFVNRSPSNSDRRLAYPLSWTLHVRFHLISSTKYADGTREQSIALEIVENAPWDANKRPFYLAHTIMTNIFLYLWVCRI